MPVVEIEAADEQEAARKLPRVYAAAYEQIDSQDLFEFATAHDFDVPVFDVPFPDFDISLFEIVIDCDNEAHQAVLLEQFLKMNLRCRSLKT